MELKRTKPYKARKPEDTIFIARRILHEKLGLLLKEEHSISEGGLYSCRIDIANYSLEDFNIGTNGKGMKFEYSLASAYGEFMERIQNQMLILYRNLSTTFVKERKIDSNSFSVVKQKDLSLKYTYAPDETYVTFESSMKYIRDYVHSVNIEELENQNIGKKIPLVPFFSVDTKNVELLPIGFILSNCTSNGMCAGNTPKEALIQGMSEILERYVVRKIYYENVSFPTIPIETFKNTLIYDRIKSIYKKYKWEFQIKDCSCGCGIPAIGVLVIDKDNMKYHFHLGVDPSPITALERTLTEIYQGRFSLTLKDIDWGIQKRLLVDNNLKNAEMFKTCVRGAGHFPISLLFNEPSFVFEGFDSSWGLSDDSDFRKMLDLFKSFNAKVYIRDVSFLGFPAYHVYVPGMSEFRNIVSNQDVRDTEMLKEVYPISRNMDKHDAKSIRLLIEYITNNEHYSFSNLRFYNTHDIWGYYNQNLVLSLLYYWIEDYRKSDTYMTLFLTDSNLSNKEKTFFTCISILIKNKAVGTEDLDTISQMYGKSMTNSCLSFLEEKQFLKFLKHSTCYKCEECPIIGTCKANEVLSLAKRIENVYSENLPNQYNINQLFVQ